VHLEVMSRETRGLDTFKIGSYDAARNDVGFVTANIRKAKDDASVSPTIHESAQVLGSQGS